MSESFIEAVQKNPQLKGVIVRCRIAVFYIADYAEYRKKNEYNEYMFRKMCHYVVDSLNDWLNCLHIGEKQPHYVRHLYDSMFSSLFIFLRDVPDYCGIMGWPEFQLRKQIQYKGCIYRYVSTGPTDYDRHGNAIDFNGLFTQWNKQKDNKYILRTVQCPATMLTAQPDDEIFGLDIDAFADFCREQGILGLDLREEREQEVIFPILEQYIVGQRTLN